jgi:hypothetical protein
LGGEAVSERFSPAFYFGGPVALRQLRYSLAAAQVVKGVFIIPEIRIGVKENLIGFSRASFGPHSLPPTAGAASPFGVAIMAPSLGSVQRILSAILWKRI